MNETIVILPQRFERPRYCNGGWLNARTHWHEDDLMLLSAACDLEIPYTAAADTIGRPPKSLAFRAAECRIRMPASWRSLVYTPRLLRKMNEATLTYPYVVRPDERHADLLAVNRMVSRAMPGREDVCQDVMLALLESKTSLQELRADPSALKAFIKSFRKSSFERGGYGGIESMDVTIHGNKGEISKYDDSRYQSDLGDAVFWGRMKVAS